MRAERAVSIADLRRLARRRLPRLVFDFIEGGVEDEIALRRNGEAFARWNLLPRYLVDVSVRNQARTLFGRRHAAPFGIAPTGMAALVRPGADLMLAGAAAEAGIPVIVSGTNTASIEEVARAAPDRAWYQLYAARDRAIPEALLHRAEQAGIGTLVVTLDVPLTPKRERNRRNGFGRAASMRPGAMLNGLLHPGWTLDWLRHGMPAMEDWRPYAPSGSDKAAVADFVSAQWPDASQSWRDLERYRALWPHTLVVKGILHPEDAARAAEIGADGIIVSNHGGRQLDRAPASIDMLPAVLDAVPPSVEVMLDSGIRRGADIVIALALGARCCFVGRATLYGAAAGGRAGVARAIAILREEIDLILGQIGCPNIDDLNPRFLHNASPAPRSGPGLSHAVPVEACRCA
jgi:L-lactate dehydrogenase (cytochrome)/(S)-mandelate dehydrogenase